MLLFRSRAPLRLPPHSIKTFFTTPPPLKKDVSSTSILDHYSNGTLPNSYTSNFLTLLESDGLDLTTLKTSSLQKFDQFHVGGYKSSSLVFSKLNIKPGHTVLDVGSGLGGPARQMALEVEGVNVVGVDLFKSYVELSSVFNVVLSNEVHDEATGRTTMKNVVPPKFFHGDCQELGRYFSAGSFDAAYMIYVGMNIPSLNKLSEQLGLVLKEKGRVSVFDVVRGGEGEVTYPLPFASREEECFMRDEDTYVEAWKVSDKLKRKSITTLF